MAPRFKTVKSDYVLIASDGDHNFNNWYESNKLLFTYILFNSREVIDVSHLTENLGF